MDEKIPIAHVRQLKDGTWAPPQTLDQHLEGTANKAKEFADVFGSGEWAYALGYAHDTGKSRKEWQRYLKLNSGYDATAHLETKTGKVDHSSPGAKLAEDVLGKGIGRILSYCIAGHHAGLPDWCGHQASLAFRLQSTATSGISPRYTERLRECKPTAPPWKFDPRSMDLSVWIRMLFSCLVDADFLDTELYMDGDKHTLRGQYLPLEDILDRFNHHMAGITKTAMEKADTAVNRARQRVLADCRAASILEPGVFSLTVPTGGGKTLSSMAFALEHAVKYGKDRVIYVIPYTSIIEQNADVFRSAIGSDQVIEHHSNLDEDDSTTQARLAAENWDAPVIVTTSVQFFESLFASKPSRCRKLHNITNSVIVLDEAQLVPVEFLSPIITVMNLLVEQYKVSFVICTATQPAFEERDDSPGFHGLPKGSIREIINDVPKLYNDLRRVEVLPIDTKTSCNWEEIAFELSIIDRVLCIVSDRKSCRELHYLMPPGTYHLSALMCAEHRSAMISEIKDKLAGDEPIRVVSTQIVEAGVDIDFPVVYRALAGLDSIAQSAGRCNREGKLNIQGKLGKMVVFLAQRKPPVGLLRKAMETTRLMIENGLDDPLDHDAFTPFFSQLYWRANSLDAHDIKRSLLPDGPELGIQFRSVAENFMIIDDRAQRSLLVPYGQGSKLIEQLKLIGPERWLLRKLQRYTVNVFLAQFNAMQARGSLSEVSPGIFAVTCSIEYDDKIGLLVDEWPTDPSAFMAIS